MSKSKPEEMLALHIRARKFPQPEREYRFVAEHIGLGPGIRERIADAGLQDWRFDFAWPEHKFAVEIEGGLHVGGRHTRGAGYENDLLKYEAAWKIGWTVYRCSPASVQSGRAIEAIAHGLGESCKS